MAANTPWKHKELTLGTPTYSFISQPQVSLNAQSVCRFTGKRLVVVVVVVVGLSFPFSPFK